MTWRAVLVGDKDLMLGLPMPERSADKGQTKCRSTPTRSRLVMLVRCGKEIT